MATTARGLAVGVDRQSDELAGLAARYEQDAGRDAASLLATISRDGVRWRGVAVLDAATRQPIATHGEHVPVDRVPPAMTAPVRVPFAVPGGARLLLAVPLSDGRTLVGLTGLVIRPLRLDTKSNQSILLVVGADTTLSQGAARRPDGSASEDLARKATEALGSRRVGSVTGQAGSRAPVLGTSAVPVATAAKVGQLDVAVVSVINAPTAGAASRWYGVLPAIVLVLIGVAVFLLVWFALVRPVLRLLDHAKAVACGEPGHLTRLPSIAELRRISRGLERPRIPAQRQAGGVGSVGNPRKQRPGIPGTFAVAAAALALVGWSCAVMVMFSRPTVDLPSQLVADAQNQAEAASASFRSIFEGSVAQLSDAARGNEGKKPPELRSTLRHLKDGSSRYRSVYLTGQDGHPVATEGKDPLRRRGKLPDRDGVHLDTANGRVPTVFAHVRLSPMYLLVGEFDVRYLTSVLRRVDGRVRLVDENLRTVLDTEGFLAFQKLSADGLRRAAGDASKGRASANVTVLHGVSSLVAAAPTGAVSAALATSTGTAPTGTAPAVAAQGAAAQGAAAQTAVELPWAVVAERAVSDFDLPVNDVRRGAWMVGIAGIFIALVLFGWLYFVVVQPLRALAGAADRLADGDVDSVISPARHDEVGAIAVCLDICRQARAHGAERLAGAVRLRGDGASQTLVLPRIPAQGKPPIPAQGRRAGTRTRPDMLRRRP